MCKISHSLLVVVRVLNSHLKMCLNITRIIIPIDMTALIAEMDPCKLSQAV
jgi:hypothetical protein